MGEKLAIHGIESTNIWATVEVGDDSSQLAYQVNMLFDATKAALNRVGINEPLEVIVIEEGNN